MRPGIEVEEKRTMEASAEKEVIRYGDHKLEDFDLTLTGRIRSKCVTVYHRDRTVLYINLDSDGLMENCSFTYVFGDPSKDELNRISLELISVAFRRGEHVLNAVSRLVKRYRVFGGAIEDLELVPQEGFKDGDVIPFLPLDPDEWPYREYEGRFGKFKKAVA